MSPINCINTIVCLSRDHHSKGGLNEQYQGGRPIVYYNCGKPGHKCPYCPKKLNRVATYNKINVLSLEGSRQQQMHAYFRLWCTENGG